MSDTLASINVDQLSSAVNAVVHPADSSTQPDNGTRGGQMQTITSNQVTGPNIQLQVPMSSLPVATGNNTITIGNNAVPVMLVRVPNPSHQLTNQVHSLPLTVTNQVQALPMVRAVAPSGTANANIVGQIGNVAIALQPKPIPVVQSAPIQTFTLPNINQPTPSSVGAFHGNQNTVATDLLNMTAAQNITFGNILSVQQKPSSDVLVLNPTGFQLNPTSTVGKPSTALTVPSASNTYTTVTTSTSQSPAVNLNLNINLPQCSTQQLQPVHQQVTGSTVQTIQTTPAVKAIPQLLGPRIQLPQQVFQQILQPVAPSNSILPSSLVNIPVLSPNVIQQTPSSVPTSNITLQMAPVLQSVASSPSLKVVQQQPTAMVSQVMTPVLTHPQMNNHSVYQIEQMIPTVSSQGVPSQLNQTSQSVNHVMSSVSQTVTCSAASLTPNTTLQSHKSQMEHVSNVTPQQAETYSASHIEPTETSEEHDEFAQDIAALAAWPPLQIPQSSTTTTLTSTNPQSSALETTTCPTDIHGSSTSHAQSLPLNITCDDSTAAHGSLPLTSVTSHLTSILSDLARPITTSSETGHDVHLQDASNQYHQHAVEAAQSQNSLHLGPTDGANNLMVDPVSTASMVAGVSAEDMEGLDITIPASLAGLSVVAADFLHDEIVTGVWCVDCKKYNTTACTKHGPIVFIRDSLIESRAKQTLPKILTIKPSKIASRFVGVFATESIPVRTQFGPVLGRIVSRDDEKTLDVESPLVWKIYSEGNLSHYIDTIDEQVSNWMMFVKLARTEKDQNLVAHQQGGTVYFTSIKTIECGEELYVWYCKDYSVWQGVPIKPEDTFACHLCPMQFSKLAQLKSHNKYSHANMNPRRWKCNMCVRAFNSQSKLNVHIWVHMGVRPHRCEQCDKTFTDPSNLRQHKLIHAGVKKFTCSLCNKGFRQKAHLESHLVIHTGEKKLKCKYCDLMFARPNDVTQHMYKHTKEKEVNCTICGRAFWRNGHLKKHMKMHSGERDFQCTQCKKSFLTSYHLKRHMQICKGPKGHRKSSSSKKDSVSHDKSPVRPVRTSSSRGRPLKRKPPFTIEARPSRLRRRRTSTSSSPMVQEFSPSTDVNIQSEQRCEVSDSEVIMAGNAAVSTEVTSSSTVDLVSEVTGDKGQSVVGQRENIDMITI